MQISSSAPRGERVLRWAMAMVSDLADSLIWQRSTSPHRQPEDVRRHATLLSMVKGVDRLFFDELSYYPEWQQDSSRQSELCAAVENPERLDDGIIRMRFNGEDFLFRFHSQRCVMEDEHSHQHGTLDLTVDGRHVLRLRLVREDEGSDRNWYEVDFETFEEGNWIRHLQDLEKQVIAQRQTRAAKSAGG